MRLHRLSAATFAALALAMAADPGPPGRTEQGDRDDLTGRQPVHRPARPS